MSRWNRSRRSHSPAMALLPPIVILATGVLLGACSGSVKSDASRSPGLSSAAALPSVKATPPAPLIEGRNIGYIRAVKQDGGVTSLVFDTAQYLDTVAKRQAAADKGWAPSDCAEVDGCFIANASTATVTVRVATDVQVTLLPPGRLEPYSGSLGELAASFASGSEEANHQRVIAPFWISMSGDEVVKIEQVYTP